MANGTISHPRPPEDERRLASKQSVYDREFENIINTNYNPTPQQLAEREANPATGTGNLSAKIYDSRESAMRELQSQNTQDQLEEINTSQEDQQSPEAEPNLAPKQRGFFKKEEVKKKSFIKRRGRLLALVGGPLLLFILIVAFIALVIAPLKHVHFADTLRTIGFARFTYQLNRQLSRVVFDAAVLTERSTGSFPPGSIISKMPGINPRSQLAQMGREGALQWDFGDNSGRWRTGGILPRESQFRGVAVQHSVSGIRGQFMIDPVAERLYGKSYQEIDRQSRSINLATRANAKKQRMIVRAQYTKELRGLLSQELVLNERMNRLKQFITFRRAVGITLVGWTANQLRQYVGKTPDEARAQTITDTVERVSGSDETRRTGLNVIDEDAEHRRQQRVAAAEQGRPVGEIRNRLARQLARTTVASDAVLAATLACLVHVTNKAFESAQREREINAARSVSLDYSKADQTRAGQSEPEASTAAASFWNGAEESAFYRTSTGRELDQEDLIQLQNVPFINVQDRFAGAIGTANDIMKAGFTIATPTVSVIDAITPGLDIRDAQMTAGCNILMNEGVQWGVAVIEASIAVFTAGALRGATAAMRTGVEVAVGLAIGLKLSDWIGSQIDDTIDRVANTDFSGITTGADRYNEDAVATNYVQQIGNRNVTFGRPISNEQAQELQQLAMEDLKEQNRNSSTHDRYFALDNPFSLTSRIVGSTPTTLVSSITKTQSLLTNAGNLIASPVKILGSILSGRTNAEPVIFAGSSYGVEEWGWTPAELLRIDSDPAFFIPDPNEGESHAAYCAREPDNYVCYVEANLEEFNNRYWDCYNYDEWVLQIDRPGKCTADLLSEEDALYWRYYMSTLNMTGILSGEV